MLKPAVFGVRRGTAPGVTPPAALCQVTGPAVRVLLFLALGAGPCRPAKAAPPWMDPARPPDERAALALQAMHEDEELSLVMGAFGTDLPGIPAPAEARPGSAGFVPGIPRLQIPPQWETDGPIGVASQGRGAPVRERTALPSGIGTAATWNPALAFAAGAMIGAEARASGFNVMLAGGVNLARDPRGGRTFEYAGEDPLLAGSMVGAEIAGIQSNHIIATAKHFAMNDQESGRTVVNAVIADKAARESDLLAFEIAIERGHPGAVMCAYNRVNGPYACQNGELLNHLLKQDWRYPGYVMSDWGAVHSVDAANAGLDQESAARGFDADSYFGTPLRSALASGEVARARLDDMARRILRAMFAEGVFDHPAEIAPIDFAAHAAVTQQDASEAIVLLKNAGGILPLARRRTRIAVIGSHADVGVLSGGGSSQVYPPGGTPVPGLGPKAFPGPEIYDPSSPLQAIRSRMPASYIGYAGGGSVPEAAALAARCDFAIVFAHQWAAESQDTSLVLPDEQDALIEAIARANPRTIVVLETGGPVLMPWLDHVKAVLEAWYPGTRGAEAIAQVLFGETDASGRLPITFPRSAAQLPRPVLDTGPAHKDAPYTVTYSEGAAIGYKWMLRSSQTPLFPFGFGLSYGRAGYSRFSARRLGDALQVTFDVRNGSARAMRDTPQVYASAPGWDVPLRLVDWQKLSLQPGATQHVALHLDPRLLASWDPLRHRWSAEAGPVELDLGTSSEAILLRTSTRLSAYQVRP